MRTARAESFTAAHYIATPLFDYGSGSRRAACCSSRAPVPLSPVPAPMDSSRSERRSRRSSPASRRSIVARAAADQRINTESRPPVASLASPSARPRPWTSRSPSYARLGAARALAGLRDHPVGQLSARQTGSTELLRLASPQRHRHFDSFASLYYENPQPLEASARAAGLRSHRAPPRAGCRRPSRDRGSPRELQDRDTRGANAEASTARRYRRLSLEA